MKQSGKGNQHIIEIQPHTPIPKVNDQFQMATNFMLCLSNTKNIQFATGTNESSDTVKIILHFLYPSAFYWLVKSSVYIHLLVLLSLKSEYKNVYFHVQKTWVKRASNDIFASQTLLDGAICKEIIDSYKSWVRRNVVSIVLLLIFMFFCFDQIIYNK